MKIRPYPSLKVAQKVINKINLPEDIVKNCYYESWANGREQGLCISIYKPSTNNGKVRNKKICVAENRNSDAILVVAENEYNFHSVNNQPNDIAWKNGRKGFDTINEAVKFIEKFIIEA